MKSVSYFDSSYSPNEACEASNNPNCGACYDDGMIVDQDVYCDCVMGDKRMNQDSKSELYEDTMGIDIEMGYDPIDDVCDGYDPYYDGGGAW